MLHGHDSPTGNQHSHLLVVPTFTGSCAVGAASRSLLCQSVRSSTCLFVCCFSVFVPVCLSGHSFVVTRLVMWPCAKQHTLPGSCAMQVPSGSFLRQSVRFLKSVFVFSFGLFFCLSVCLFVCLFVCLCVCLFVCLSVCLFVCRLIRLWYPHRP